MTTAVSGATDYDRKSTAGESPSEMRRLSIRVFATAASLWLLIVYLAIVVPMERWIPALNQRLLSMAGVAVAFAAAYILIRTIAARSDARVSKDRLNNVTLLCLILLFSLLVVDVVSAVYLNLSPRYRNTPDLYAGRDADRQAWLGELLPKTYYPSAENFFLYKPLQQIAGYTYGENYSPQMLRHKILKEQVLIRHRAEYIIDEHGFRNTIDPRNASIFTLGDSFCFGYDVPQNQIFQGLLSSKYQQPVYNLGVSGSSPWQQYLLLRHLLQNEPNVFHPKRLLWLVFEGNDLEEDYSPFRPMPEYVQSTASKAFRRTLIDTVFSLPDRLRDQSLIRAMTSGEIVFRRRSAQGQSKTDHYVVDGERFAFPLYYSPVLGYKLFRPVYLERAGQPASYVANHPNLPRLREAFERMRDLSKRYAFQVTVVVVPSEVRVYKDSFEDFPVVSKEPYLLQEFMRLADASGFPYINLNELLAPFAKTELLYHRDDTHWNERGHERVAEIVASRI